MGKYTALTLADKQTTSRPRTETTSRPTQADHKQTSRPTQQQQRQADQETNRPQADRPSAIVHTVQIYHAPIVYNDDSHS